MRAKPLTVTVTRLRNSTGTVMSDTYRRAMLEAADVRVYVTYDPEGYNADGDLRPFLSVRIEDRVQRAAA